MFKAVIYFTKYLKLMSLLKMQAIVAFLNAVVTSKNVVIGPFRL